MRGNDGNLYEVVLNKNGVKRWRKFDSDLKIDGNKILIKTTRKDGSIYWKWDPSLSVEDLKTGKRRPFNELSAGDVAIRFLLSRISQFSTSS